jgi:hypothetical protein
LAGLTTLGAGDAAELLGHFTHFFLHFTHAFFTLPVDAPVTRAQILVPTSDLKNWNDVMIKTGTDQTLLNINREISDQIYTWFTAKKWGQHDSDHTREMYVVWKDALVASGDANVRVCGAEVGKLGKMAIGMPLLKRLVQNFDPFSGARVPTSPTGSNPPAYIGGLDTFDGYSMAVVEVRYHDNAFNTLATNANAAGVNAAIKPLTKAAYNWNGAADTWPA